MLNKVAQKQKNNNWKKIIDQLVIENCLAFGDDAKFTQKKVARYLLGTRATTEIFKLYELRYLLLKIYPFIQNLFYNPRLSSTLKTKKIWNQNYQKQLETQRKLGTRLPSREWKPRVKIINSFAEREKNLTPQVLFATVTPLYTDIVKAAAEICNMPSHESRWLNGSITAAISYQEDHLRWNYLTDETQVETLFHATRKWGSNKENPEKTKEKMKYHGESRWPSLIIIPDIANNIMILKEAKKVGLPVMGLVNSSTPFEIDYPIFAQDQTVQSVHFFCHFLATLIAKEMVYLQHKRYILQKKKRKLKVKVVLKNNSFLPKGHVLQSKNRHKPLWRNAVFFRIVKPTNNYKRSDREWHAEYSALPPKGSYFCPEVGLRRWSYRKWLALVKKRKSNLRKNSKELLEKKFPWKKLKVKKVVNVQKGQKLWRALKEGKLKKKRIRFKWSFFPRIIIKKSKIKRNGFLIRTRVSRTRTKVIKKVRFKPRKYFRHLESRHFLRIIKRYLQKRKNSGTIIKKQKYLTLMLNLQKRLLVRSRSRFAWPFLKQEASKKKARLKKTAFLLISEQRQLWKKLNQFLVSTKIKSVQLKNKLLRFNRAKLLAGYKNYYALSLKQWKQTNKFYSAKHTFRILLNYISYKERLVESLYYDEHPDEWRAELARRYKNRSWSSKKNNKNPEQNQPKGKYNNQNAQNQKWAQWAEKNTVPQGKNPYPKGHTIVYNQRVLTLRFADQKVRNKDFKVNVQMKNKKQK